jgi:hypothetical protein
MRVTLCCCRPRTTTPMNRSLQRSRILMGRPHRLVNDICLARATLLYALLCVSESFVFDRSSEHPCRQPNMSMTCPFSPMLPDRIPWSERGLPPPDSRKLFLLSLHRSTKYHPFQKTLSKAGRATREVYRISAQPRCIQRWASRTWRRRIWDCCG